MIICSKFFQYLVIFSKKENTYDKADYIQVENPYTDCIVHQQKKLIY